MTPLFQARRQYCSLFAPTTIKSAQNGALRQLHFSRPFGYGFRLIADCNKSVVSAVAVLRNAASPPAICGFVIARTIDSVNRKIFRALAHVFQKKRVAVPTSANDDSACAVMRVAGGRLSIAARVHAQPYLVCLGVAPAMCAAQQMPLFLSFASARLRSRTKGVPSNSFCNSAIANYIPPSTLHAVRRSADYQQSRESFPSQVIKFLHSLQYKESKREKL